MTSIEILCIGNEILSGVTVNTNASWLCKEITHVGGVVNRVIVVQDDVKIIDSTTRESLHREPNWLITCGGLGPTYDDKTLEGISRGLRTRLVLNSSALNMVKQSYKKQGRIVRLNKARIKMALIPNGSIPIMNPVGNAPAVRVNIKKTKIVCLPGVPSEMKAIFINSILSEIKQEVGEFTLEERLYRVEGVSEAMLSGALTKLVKTTPRESLYLKTHPQGYTNKNIPIMNIQVVSRGRKKDAVRLVLDRISNEIISEVIKHKGKIQLK
jgi:molybdenum cofactor synthesis domain-containing protein